MKKKILISFFTASIFILTTFNLSRVNEKSTSEINLLFLVERAFADTEQPNTADCVSDPNYDCEALHPTDSSKDQIRENAKWE